MSKRVLAVYGLVALVAAVPWVLDNRYIFHIAALVTIMIPLALSMYLMIQLGQLSIAQPAFMGIGAYAAALLAIRLGWPTALTLLSGGLIAAALALVCGPIFLRIKGVYFVLLTYAFAQIVHLVFQEWTSLFGGNGGLYGIPRLTLFGIRLTSGQDFYLLGLLLAVAAYACIRAIERSDIGAIMKSLEENEMLARSAGSDALAWRVVAFTFSAFLAGITGGVYAYYIRFLSPDPFGFKASVDLIVINVIGGAGSALGPVLGAIVIVPLPELLREARQYQLLIYGACLLFFLVFLQQGLSSLIERRKGS